MSAKTANLDTAIWSRLKQGHSESLGQLYDMYADKLFTYALRMTPDRDLAKDALQEVFVEIWNYRNTLGDVVHSQGYLIKVIRSIIIKKLKKEKLVVHNEIADTFISSDDTIETIIISADTERDTHKRLQLALAGLTSRQHQLLRLRFYEGLNYEQIAEKLQMNYQSVNNLAFRTINRLRNQLLILPFFALFFF
ncbi:MAG TPA: sigma-70 family RNA polymerase sigma factor [Flavitalea sp.]|nr:sigma-70 family RNA polymerase sigma factor [Flavitalea sp.]